MRAGRPIVPRMVERTLRQTVARQIAMVRFRQAAAPRAIGSDGPMVARVERYSGDASNFLNVTANTVACGSSRDQSQLRRRSSSPARAHARTCTAAHVSQKSQVIFFGRSMVIHHS